jgi:threonine aldolase
MGMQPYLTAISATEESRMALGKHYPCTNSPFSDHIQLLQRMLKNKLDTSGPISTGWEPTHRWAKSNHPPLEIQSPF